MLNTWTLVLPTCPTNLGISLAYFTINSPYKHADTAIQLLIVYLSSSWITSLDIDTVWLYGPYLLCNIESLKQVQTAICSSFMPQLLNNSSSSSMMVRPSQFKTPSLPGSYCTTLKLLTACINCKTYIQLSLPGSSKTISPHTDYPTVPLWVGQSLFQTNCPTSHMHYPYLGHHLSHINFSHLNIKFYPCS